MKKQDIIRIINEEVNLALDEMYDPIYDSFIPEILGMITLGTAGVVKAIKYLKSKGLDKQAIIDVINKAKEKVKSNINENEEKEYEVEYTRTYKDGEEDFETIKVKATSEADALEKAKKEAPRATRKFKIIK